MSSSAGCDSGARCQRGRSRFPRPCRLTGGYHASARLIPGGPARTDGVRRPFLLDEAVRLSRQREGPLGYGHLDRRFRAQRSEGFALSIPARIESRELCLLLRGFAGCPPLLKLLVPARAA